MTSTSSLAGKWVLVSGGSRGIGDALKQLPVLGSDLLVLFGIGPRT